MRLSDFLRGIGRPVVYYPSLNPITGGVTATIFLLTFVQWHGTQHDPQGWIYKTQGEIERETGLSRYEQETARKQLRTRDLLREKRRGVPARLHYRVQLDRLNAAWERNATIKNGGNPQTGMGGTDEQVWGEAADYLRVHDPGETNRENDVEHSNLRTVSPDNASVEQDAPHSPPLHMTATARRSAISLPMLPASSMTRRCSPHRSAAQRTSITPQIFPSMPSSISSSWPGR